MYLTNMSYVRHLKYAKVNLNAYNLKLFDTQNRQATCLFFYMVLGQTYLSTVWNPVSAGAFGASFGIIQTC